MWRRALQSVVTLDDDIQAAMRDGDSERIKELNAILGYRNLVVALGSVPYVLETGAAPSESLFVAAPAPGAAPATAAPADGEDPAAASAPAPPPAKRTRARKT
jgi:pyruvate dehydrogenase E2 component (dihydrolipoamide acetyltransferase)